MTRNQSTATRSTSSTLHPISAPTVHNRSLYPGPPRPKQPIIIINNLLNKKQHISNKIVVNTSTCWICLPRERRSFLSPTAMMPIRSRSPSVTSGSTCVHVQNKAYCCVHKAMNAYWCACTRSLYIYTDIHIYVYRYIYIFVY